MSEVIREVLAFQFAVWFGFCVGMACMAFLWWMSGKGRR